MNKIMKNEVIKNYIINKITRHGILSIEESQLNYEKLKELLNWHLFLNDELIEINYKFPEIKNMDFNTKNVIVLNYIKNEISINGKLSNEEQNLNFESLKELSNEHLILNKKLMNYNFNIDELKNITQNEKNKLLEKAIINKNILKYKNLSKNKKRIRRSSNKNFPKKLYFKTIEDFFS